MYNDIISTHPLDLLSLVQTMEQQMTPLCDIDPMMDVVKVLFEPFQNFKTRHFGPTDLVVSRLSNIYSNEYLWAEKFNGVVADEMESTAPVVMILQLAKVKYFNDKPSVGNCLFLTKFYINEKLPEIEAFKQRQWKRMEEILVSVNDQYSTLDEYDEEAAAIAKKEGKEVFGLVEP
ncbi:hypothetical protein Tco_0937830 [Tanacetum coccineum]|uniref:Uncharacterized protein n=1 Tax=Tanacetum coccineum TaxID=301880 RepID=A0ABQ5DFD8_9ASTR